MFMFVILINFDLNSFSILICLLKQVKTSETVPGSGL